MAKKIMGSKSKSADVNLRAPEYYWNRELSWLQFNRRCLAQARSAENPLMERLNFLSITASNLDEFFMVRVASLQDMIVSDYKKRDIAGMTAPEQLGAILADAHEFVRSQYTTLNRQLIPALAGEGITIVHKASELRAEERAFLDEYFETEVYPVLTPMAVDSSRPFPLILNKSLNIGALVTRKKNAGPGVLNRTGKAKKAIKSAENLEIATVQVPAVLPRVIRLPGGEDLPQVHGRPQTRVILLETLIREHMEQLFLNYDIVCASPFRIMRSADMDIDEDGAEDLLREIEKQLKQRRHGYAIRLEIEEGVDERLLEILTEELSVKAEEIFTIDGNS